MKAAERHGLLEARVERLLLAGRADTLESAEVAEARVELAGLEGDRHFGLTAGSDSRTPYYPRGTEIRNSRQVSLVSVEDLEQIARALGLPEIRPEWLGANLLLSGLDGLTRLPPSSKLFFPADAVLVVAAENAPCLGPGKVIERHHPERPGLASEFPRQAMRRRGLVAWVERAGRIRKGDRVRILPARRAE